MTHTCRLNPHMNTYCCLDMMRRMTNTTNPATMNFCCLDMMRRMSYITNSATMNVKMPTRRPMQSTIKTCKLYSLAL